MIISKTPYRISFFGGGTDLPFWTRSHGGAVISTTIDKYCYLTCRDLPPFFEHRHRVVYSKVETVKTVKDIQHPVVRSVLSWLRLDHRGLEIHHDGDLPARSGLGSSSSFTVGFLNAIYTLTGQKISPKILADDSIFVEQTLLEESGGSQDQVAAAFGGFNYIKFHPKGGYDVVPINLRSDLIGGLQSRMLLFFTGVQRISSPLEKLKESNASNNNTEFRLMMELTSEALSCLNSSNMKFEEFGSLLLEGWRIKRSFCEGVSTPLIDEAVSAALDGGAMGAKILGAGGGGFLLVFADPRFHDDIKLRLHKLIHINFKFEPKGTSVVANL